MAAAIVLGLAAAAQFALPSEAAMPDVPKHKPAPVAPEAARPAMQIYAAVMAHPIFAPDRAPPPTEAEEAGNLSGVEVLGVAIAGKDRAAALLRDSDGSYVRLKSGEEIEGWKLVSIAPEELVFDRNGEKRSLNVDAEKLKSQQTTATGPGARNGVQAPISEPSDDDSDDSDDE
jgi:hypothetical protein